MERYGIQPGDRVLSVANNRPDMMTLLLACLKTGAIFAPLASDLIPEHTLGLIENLEPSLIVAEADNAKLSAALAKKQQRDESADGCNCPVVLHLEDYRRGSTKTGLVEIESCGLSDEPVDILSKPDECAIIFSTSGSTGIPKGVMHSHASLDVLGNIITLSQMMGDPFWSQYSPGDKQLLWVPFRGVAGVMFAMSAATAGMVSVMVDAPASGPQDWAPLLEKHDIDHMLLFGSAMHELQQQMPERQFESVKSIVYGGSCLAPSLVQKSMRQFPNAQFQQGYGMTEILGISSLEPSRHVPASDDTSANDEALSSMASAGKPMAIAEVFIEDANREGSYAPPPPEAKGVGQICVKNPAMMMMGYWRNPEATAKTIIGEHVRTGDIGYFDEQGQLHVVDRMKHIIPTHRGFNVAPRDIEEVLYQHPSVAQAAVAGVPHPSGAGEMVAAWVSLKPGAAREGVSESMLVRHCKEAGLPDFQMPERITISDTPLPTQGNKLSRAKLRESVGA